MDSVIRITESARSMESVQVSVQLQLPINTVLAVLYRQLLTRDKMLVDVYTRMLLGRHGFSLISNSQVAASPHQHRVSSIVPSIVNT